MSTKCHQNPFTTFGDIFFNRNDYTHTDGQWDTHTHRHTHGPEYLVSCAPAGSTTDNNIIDLAARLALDAWLGTFCLHTESSLGDTFLYLLAVPNVTTRLVNQLSQDLQVMA